MSSHLKIPFIRVFLKAMIVPRMESCIIFLPEARYMGSCDEKEEDACEQGRCRIRESTVEYGVPVERE